MFIFLASALPKVVAGSLGIISREGETTTLCYLSYSDTNVNPRESRATVGHNKK